MLNIILPIRLGPHPDFSLRRVEVKDIAKKSLSESNLKEYYDFCVFRKNQYYKGFYIDIIKGRRYSDNDTTYELIATSNEYKIEFFIYLEDEFSDMYKAWIYIQEKINSFLEERKG